VPLVQAPILEGMMQPPFGRLKNKKM